MADLTPEAQRDLAWLVRKLGKEKVSGPEQTTEPPEIVEWMMTLTRADGRKVWYFGPTPEAAIAMARKWVEGPTKNRRTT